MIKVVEEHPSLLLPQVLTAAAAGVHCRSAGMPALLTAYLASLLNQARRNIRESSNANHSTWLLKGLLQLDRHKNHSSQNISYTTACALKHA